MKLLLYCTKAKPYLADFKGEYQTYSNGKELDELFDKGFNPNDIMNILNGKIVAECDFDVEEIYIGKSYGFPRNIEIVYTDSLRQPIYLSQKSCLKLEDICEYLNHKDGYAIHIKNLHIFDKQKELSEFVTKRCQYAICSSCRYGKDNIKCSTIDNEVDKAPQNMMCCYGVDGKRYVLISIKPEWLCKILNGEKTIEVRKKVLKEMLK